MSAVRTVVYSLVAVTLSLLLAEAALHIAYGSLDLRIRYQWWIGTHLVDISYADFVRRQQTIQNVRARLGMERGETHPIFGWTYNPTFHIDEDGIQIHINSLGLRGEEFAEQKPPSEIRIMCLGGSTTAGEEVREAETYPAQLQAVLRAHYPDRAIRVINAGIPSYDVPKSFLQYALLGYRLAPDYVTIYHGINDLFYHRTGGAGVVASRNYAGGILEPYVYQGDARDSFWHDALRSFVQRSYLMRLVRSIAEPLLSARHTLRAPDPRGIDEFIAYYRALVRQVVATGATPIPMTFAIAYPGDFDAAGQKKIEQSLAVWLHDSDIPLAVGKQIIDQQNDAIVALSRDQGLPLAAIAGTIPQDRRTFLDVCHLTAEGNKRIADSLAATLIPLIDARGVVRAAG